MAHQISIGFHASPPLSLRVEDKELEKLEKAIGSDGWHELEAQDGRVRLNLAQLLWLRVDRDEQRIGFGA